MARIVPAAEDAIVEAAAILRTGGLVAFPTETVYGLGANALDAAAVAQIFAAKGRPATNPLIVHVASLEDVDKVASVGAVAEGRAQHAAPLHILAERFWPGPLTVVLPKHPGVPDMVTAGGPTVAVRVPAHPVAQALLRAAGVPLAAPSANRSEQVSPTRAQHVAESLSAIEDLLILDGGPTEIGLESTVVDLTCNPPRLLRPGMVTVAALEAALGTALAVGPPDGGSEPARAPGQMPRHYAPRAPLRLVADPWAEAANHPHSAVLAHTPPSVPPPAPLRAAAVLPADPAAYAAALYDTLHRLDSLRPSAIFAQAVPDTADWLAIRDRLTRAAAPAKEF